MYDYASIVPLVSLALLPLSALYVVANTLVLKRRMGPLVESFCPRFHFQFLGVLLFSPALIALAWYREFTSLPVFDRPAATPRDRPPSSRGDPRHPRGAGGGGAHLAYF